MSSILTFSNRAVKLFTLKNRFLIIAKALHSIRMCLTVQVVWQIEHCCCGSCFLGSVIEKISALFLGYTNFYHSAWIISIWFSLVWLYGISTLVGYLIPNRLYTQINIYDLLTHFVVITLNEPKLILLHTVK